MKTDCTCFTCKGNMFTCQCPVGAERDPRPEPEGKRLVYVSTPSGKPTQLVDIWSKLNG